MSGLSLGAPRSKRTTAGPSTGNGGGGGGKRGGSDDEAVRATDSDALLSRISAQRTGSIQAEPYSAQLLPPTLAAAAASSTPSPLIPRRPPIINIGTALRCVRLDEVVQQFLGEGEAKKQIISLGAGSDARFWRLKSASETASKLAHYLELDFPQLTRAKVERIIRSDTLREVVVSKEEHKQGKLEVKQMGSELHSPFLTILPCDLRTIAEESSEVAQSILARLDPTFPTLLLAECVLSYLPPDSGDALLAWFSRHFPSLTLVCYDMCLAGIQAPSAREGAAQTTKFGDVMIQNLEARGLGLPGARVYNTPQSHADRLSKALALAEGHKGEVKSNVESLRYIWSNLSHEELRRLSRLEGLDEVEELELLLGHYAVSFASRTVVAGKEKEPTGQ